MELLGLLTDRGLNSSERPCSMKTLSTSVTILEGGYDSVRSMVCTWLPERLQDYEDSTMDSLVASSTPGFP